MKRGVRYDTNFMHAHVQFWLFIDISLIQQLLNTFSFPQAYNTVDFVTTAFSMFSGIVTAISRLISFVVSSVLIKSGTNYEESLKSCLTRSFRQY